MRRYAMTELLVALWRIGGVQYLPDDGQHSRILRDNLAALPEGLATNLTFGVTGVGFRCYELADLLFAAQELELISYESPEFSKAFLKFSEETAYDIFFENNISGDEARAIGGILVSAVR